jgi:DNA adenine methylase
LRHPTSAERRDRMSSKNNRLKQLTNRARGIPNAGKYPGSKARLFPTVWQMVPPHRHHAVLFGGIGAELCAKPAPSYLETLCDKNDDVINAFRVLREREEEVIGRLELHMYSEAEFNEQAAVLRSAEPDPLRRAIAFFLVAMQSRAFHDPTVDAYQTWAFSMKAHRDTQSWARIRERLSAVARRFREVQLPDSGRDWSWAVDHCDGYDVVFTADPPFMADTLNCSTPLYRHNMTDAEHERMLMRLRRIDGYAMVFHYWHPLYCDLLRDWSVVRVPTVVSMSPASRRPVKDTLVWVNWEGGRRKVLTPLPRLTRC